MPADNEAFSESRIQKKFLQSKPQPNPSLIRILKEKDVGLIVIISELMLSDAIGFSGERYFSSNVTPPEDFILARKLNAI